MPDPWDRLPDEPSLWYDRFETYRLLGVRRSVSRAYRICRLSQELKRPHVHSRWYGVAERWNWASRAEAWDEVCRTEFRERQTQRIQDAQNARIDMIQSVLERSFDRILPELDDVEKLDLNTLRHLFRDMLNEERKELPVDATPVRDDEFAFTADDMLRAQRRLDDWQDVTHPTSNADRLLALRACLMNLYPETASARRVAEQAGLSLQRVAMSGRAVDTWHAILTEAERNDQIPDLIAVAHSEYPNNLELQACMKTHLVPTAHPPAPPQGPTFQAQTSHSQTKESATEAG